MSARQVMVVTGTSSGIGRHLAQYYADAGFDVIGCSRRPTDIKSAHYKHFILDVTDETKVRDMFFEISKAYDRLDVLINNAGSIAFNYALLTPLQSVRNLMDTNFIGPFLFSCEAVKLMQKNRFGRIVNISSIAVPLAAAGSSVYGATKAALEQFSKTLAKEVAMGGITVNSLGLSFVKGSGMIVKMSDKTVRETLEKTIMKSSLEYHDVVSAIDYLISSKSAMVTGQTLYLGGV